MPRPFIKRLTSNRFLKLLDKLCNRRDLIKTHTSIKQYFRSRLFKMIAAILRPIRHPAIYINNLGTQRAGMEQPIHIYKYVHI